MRAVRVTEVSREAYRMLGRAPLLEFAGDARPWQVRGPRGGRYIATGATTWQVDEGGFYDMDTVRFIGRRSEVRYVRPSSKAAMAAFEEAVG